MEPREHSWRINGCEEGMILYLYVSIEQNERIGKTDAVFVWKFGPKIAHRDDQVFRYTAIIPCNIGDRTFGLIKLFQCKIEHFA